MCGYYDDGRGRGWDYDRNRSKNASSAEAYGFLPISRWKAMSKEEIIDYCEEKRAFCDDDDLIVDWMQNQTKKTLIGLLIIKEWHHVGIFRRPVDYYGFGAEIEMRAIPADPEIKAKKKAYLTVKEKVYYHRLRRLEKTGLPFGYLTKLLDKEKLRV